MLGYVVGPQSIWQGVRQVAPGTIVALEPHKGAAVATYWSLAKAAGEGLASPLRGGDEEAVEAAAALLADAVRRQLVSDVPIGAFLSGGIDSTSVVALMQAASSRPVKTFTIGFADRSLDEARHAAAVARHLGTEHTTLEATEAEALAIVPRLADIYDEPFADSSQIPTALVSALTRKHVTVALSGDGGDEVFAGYNRHRFAAGIGRSLQAWPAAVRHLTAAALSGRIAAGAAAMSSRLLPAVLPSQLDDKLRKLADVLRYDETDGYCRLVSQAAAVDEVAAVPAAFERAIGLPPQLASSLDALGRMQLRDAMTYLPGDVLTKVDRAAMAVALEVRVPLLDHRVVEFAWRLPASMRVRKGATKWLLRRVLERFVPSHLVERPKQGFAVPLAAWLRGPLREWAEDLLCGVDFGGGYLERAPARMLWNDCLAGRTGCEYAIWPLLMFESWRLRHATRPQRHAA
jgi:asparagine synthase (glutamine-hydrolysing)